MRGSSVVQRKQRNSPDAEEEVLTIQVQYCTRWFLITFLTTKQTDKYITLQQIYYFSLEKFAIMIAFMNQAQDRKMSNDRDLPYMFWGVWSKAFYRYITVNAQSIKKTLDKNIFQKPTALRLLIGFVFRICLNRFVLLI